MTRLIPFALLAALAAAPAVAQDADPGAGPGDGPSLVEKGARLMFEGLLQEVRPGVEALPGLADDLMGQVQPGLDQLSDLADGLLPVFQALAQEMGPGILDVAGQIDSLTYYEPPEIQPNGDILLRRKPDAPAWVAPADRPDPATGPGTDL